MRCMSLVYWMSNGIELSQYQVVSTVDSENDIKKSYMMTRVEEGKNWRQFLVGVICRRTSSSAKESVKNFS